MRKYFSLDAKEIFCAPVKISRKASIKVTTCTVSVIGIMSSMMPIRIFRMPDMISIPSLK